MFDQPFIGTKEQAPEYMVYNPYILTGYRINYNTVKLTIKSIFQLHNETMNIWTHGLGFIFCTVVLFVFSCSQIGEHINNLTQSSVDYLSGVSDGHR